MLLRIGIAVVLLMALLVATAGAGTVRSKHGATANVAKVYVTKFQCLVDWLDGNGYRIKIMTGWKSRGSVPSSLHPFGAALDIDQGRRNGLIHGKRFPEGVNAAAGRCGLVHADRTVWKRHPDYGHFQVSGVSYASLTGRRKRTGQYAQHTRGASLTSQPWW